MYICMHVIVVVSPNVLLKCKGGGVLAYMKYRAPEPRIPKNLHNAQIFQTGRSFL